MSSVQQRGSKRSILAEKLSKFPRFNVARLPTPLDEAERFSATLGGVRVLIKREDMTGLAFGGNKARELDFFIGDALASGADVFIAGGGGAQSNHAVLCAAAARRAGLIPVMVLHRSPNDESQGNPLLGRLLGTDLRFADTTDTDAAVSQRTALLSLMQQVAEEYRVRGFRPYVLPSSFHVLGALAYVDAARELEEQVHARNINIDHVYLSSAGATQVGLALGAKYLGCPLKVTGINYAAHADQLTERLIELGRKAAEALQIDIPLTSADVPNESFAGPGYGVPTSEAIDAIQILARTEGLFLDPVYTGKGMAGLLSHVRSGRIRAGQTVVFVHTGGLPALFANSKRLGIPE